MARALVIVILLSACGVDGAPTPPLAKSTPPGITMSGSVQVGIATDGG